MLGLSPIRLLIIGIVALILLGPDKLPNFARQAGAAWKTLKSLQERVEDELREAVPDLPRTSDIARYARSPMSLLNRLADNATTAEGTTEDATSISDGYTPPDDPSDEPRPPRPPVAWGDPSLN